MADFDPDAFAAKAQPKAEPEGFDPEAFLAKANPRPKTSPHVDLMEGHSGLGGGLAKFGAGIGLGALSTARSGVELLSHIPGLKDVMQSALAKLPEVDKDVQSALVSDPNSVLATVPSWVPLAGGATFTPGGIGNFTGEMAATAPLGGLAGGLAKKALAKTGLQALARLGAAEGGQYAARAAVKLLPLMAEGVSQGSLLAGPGRRLQGAIEGGAFAPTLGALLSGTGTLARGFVRPTEEAAELMSRGVPLSVGQMNPGGVLSKIEEAGAHSALGGPTIQAARDAALPGLQRAVVREIGTPGFEAPKSGPIKGGELQELFDAFEPAYEPLKATKVPASVNGVPTGKILREAFKRVSEDNSTLAPDSTRSMVNRFLQDQASTLDRAPLFNESGEALSAAPRATSSTRALVPVSELRITAPVSQWAEAPLSEATASMRSGAAAAPESARVMVDAYHTAEPLLKVRSEIRNKLRGLSGPNADPAAREMLSNAEGLVSDALNKRLGPEGAAKLQSVDQAYARYKVLEDAIARAGDSESGFTSAQLQAAVKKATPKGAYARGGGGTLRDLAALGRAVLEDKSPKTGAIKQTLPFGLNHAAGPLGALLNGSGRDFALGVTPTQRSVQTLMDLLRKASPGFKFAPSPNAYLAPLEVDQR